MKRLLLFAAATLALASCHSSAQAAGVDFQKIPPQGKAGYVQLPDGTFGPAQGDAAGNAKASASPYVFTKLGCYQITSLGSAAALPTVPAGTLLVSLSVEGQPVRMRDDGTNPTASVGLLLPVGGPWPYQADLAAVRFIQTASSATIDYCAYK